MTKLVPFIIFKEQAEQAVDFYVSLFENSGIQNITYYPDDAHGVKGSILTVEFTLNGQPYVAMNGGDHFQLTDAFSISATCQDQAEIDRLWNALTSDGGKEVACGWLTDKFGLSWQIVPDNLDQLLNSQAAYDALWKMKKIVIADLVNAGK